jgi:hypothetical protein
MYNCGNCEDIIFGHDEGLCLLEGKRPLGRSRHRWENNIKMNLQEVGCVGMDWIELAQVRERWWALVTAVMNFQVP